MAPNPSSSNSNSSNTNLTSKMLQSSSSLSLQTWITDIESNPTKIILLSSLILHLCLLLCVLTLCFKYRSLSTRFKRLKNSLKQELDDRKKETTKLHNFFNNTRPPTQSTSGVYFDDCFADQKLLPVNGRSSQNGQNCQNGGKIHSNGVNNNGLNHRSSTSTVLAQSPKQGDDQEERSTPPTPLPRSKSKPEFQLNASNNNNVTEADDIIKPKILKEMNNNEVGDANDSWFIPVTPATARCKSTKPLVQHTPMAERSKHNSGPGPRSITAHVNNSPPKLNGSLNTSSEANTSFNPLAGLTLWEQHESRPVLKHQT